MMNKKMKKMLLAAALAAAMLLLSGCGEEQAQPTASSVPEVQEEAKAAASPVPEVQDQAKATTASVPEVLDQGEYLLYQNIFYNDYGPEYEGQEMVKRGVYASLQDAFSGRTRYYVWGYLDNTKCCDWQWEFVPKDPGQLPAEGSLVAVTGTFRASDDALDGYWMENASVQTEEAYTGKKAEINMRAMSCTLERVQMLNIIYRPDSFENKAFIAYGRIAGANTLEDPYYNGSWQIRFAAIAEAPAVGTVVNVEGRVSAGTLTRCVLEITP